MSNELSSESYSDQLIVYQIRIKGHLGLPWMEWFAGLIITLEEDGNTLLTGTVIDQAALHGLLKKVRDLGMPLLSVNRVNPNEVDVPIVKPVLGANNQEKSDL
ncbi:MAG: hypothetical protein NTW32_01250 [Chloroflexi bacterium]|nr:hypothetical protein [Chloroflexota bacterium]